jgi:glucosamine--fructose-6-phosphate aminotransferase (isomerizing)
VSCGTAYYAACTAKYWFEDIARLPLEVDIASEFRYRNPVLPQTGPALFVSQSGETADTLAALRYCRARDMASLAIVNVPESSIAREASALLPTRAGPEIGVASTKAFTAQLAVLALAAVSAGKARGWIDRAREEEYVRELLSASRLVAQTLKQADAIAPAAHALSQARDVLFLGRGPGQVLAWSRPPTRCSPRPCRTWKRSRRAARK